MEDFVKAGKIASQAREYGRKLIKPGVSLLEVSDKVESKIESLGGGFGFPTQISRNVIAAHYCAHPNDETLFKEGDLIKLDLGVHINGSIADTACTIDLGDNKELLEASKNALQNAIKILRPGLPIGQIGRVVQDTITDAGFSPIKNLCGHGVGKFIVHKEPSIPNFDNGDPTELFDGQIIAIEPFASSGVGMIHEVEPASVFMQVANKSVRNPITRIILKQIQSYNKLPFTNRWFTKDFSEMKVNFALRDLLQNKVIRSYGPLKEKMGLVSQHEHTIIIKEKPIVTTL